MAAGWRSADHRDHVVALGTEWGSFWDGDRSDLDLSWMLKAGGAGSMGLGYSQSHITLPAGEFTTRIFSAALERLRVRAGETVFVGDHAEQDLAGARRVGLQAVDATALATLADLPCLPRGGEPS